MNKNSKLKSCDVNFSKLKSRSVKVYVGDKKHDGVEIIGSRGKYAIHTDSNNEQLAKLRGKSGSLKEVKRYVSSHLCDTDPVQPQGLKNTVQAIANTIQKEQNAIEVIPDMIITQGNDSSNADQESNANPI